VTTKLLPAFSPQAGRTPWPGCSRRAATSCRSPEHAGANGVEENVGADAIERSASQLNRLNDVEPPVGDRYADMTPINR
jgi:hypothetical protein